MKIVTVTSQKAYNYGAVLQSYALQQTLLSLGYENEILDHAMPTEVKRHRKSVKALLRDGYLSLLRLLHAKEYRRYCNNFKDFVKNNLRLTRTYSSVEEIQNSPPAADCYLTGSDQVFALGNQMVPIRYLDFGAAETPRVSYAASLGSYDMKDEELVYIKERLSCFDRISIREKQGSEYLFKAIGATCETHIDPVFLLPREKWEELLPQENRVTGEYILVYPMMGNANLQNVIDKVKKETGLPVISIQNKFVKTVKADRYLFDVSVPEFLRLIRDARAVITTSFHATSFSVVFGRPFYTLVGKYKPERARNLCAMFGLGERVVDYHDKVFPAPSTDYSAVDEIIAQQRARALAYLSSLRDLQNG